MADIRTKDGIIIRGVPDGQENSAQTKSIVLNIRSTGGTGEFNYADVVKTSPIVEQTEQIPTTVEGVGGALTRELTPALAGATAGGLAAGLPGALAGAAAVELAPLVGDPIVQNINNLLGTNLTKPSDALTLLFDKLGVAQPQSEAEKIIQAAASGAAETVTGVGVGKAMQAGKTLAPTVATRIGGVLASGPVQQVAGGAGSAALSDVAGQVAEQAGAGPGGQALAELAGGVIGGSLASGAVNRKIQKLPEAPIEEAKKAGVKLMTSDIRQPQTFASRWGQSIGEKIPVFGTGGARQMQQSQRVDAVRDLIRQYGADDLSGISDDIMDDLVKTRTTKFNKYSKNKNDVIKKLTDNVEDKIVPVDNTIAEIDKQITNLQNLNTQEVQPVIDRLVDWKGAVQEQDLQNIETLRKQLGESFKSPELSGVRSTGEKALSSIYKGIKQDMSSYISDKGTKADLTKWEASNKELSKMIKELDNTALKRVLDKGEATPEIVDNLLFSKKKSDVSALYNNLSDRGKAAARTAVIQKVAKTSVSPGTDIISPDRFANNVKKLGTQTGVVFNDRDRKELEGLIKVLDFTKRAGQAASNPQTGQTLVPFATASAGAGLGEALGIGAVPGSIATAIITGSVAKAYESKPVRDILIKLPTVTAGSPQEAALYKRLTEAVRAVETEGEE